MTYCNFNNANREMYILYNILLSPIKFFFWGARKEVGLALLRTLSSEQRAFKGAYAYLANKLTRLLSAMSGRNKNFDVMAT